MRKLIIAVLATCIFGFAVIAQTPSPTPDPNPDKTRADRLQARLNDFANLARYREANTKLAPLAKGKNRIVFMGDSITDGWKLNEYFPNQPYVNRGISGQTTPQMLLRFRPDGIALRPKGVLILAGTKCISSNIGPTTLETIE